MIIANIHQAKSQLSALIQKALEGEEIIIAKNHEPIVTLKPIVKTKKKRKSGTLRGKIKIIEEWTATDSEIEDLLINSKLFPDE